MKTVAPHRNGGVAMSKSGSGMRSVVPCGRQGKALRLKQTDSAVARVFDGLMKRLGTFRMGVSYEHCSDDIRRLPRGMDSTNNTADGVLSVLLVLWMSPLLDVEIICGELKGEQGLIVVELCVRPRGLRDTASDSDAGVEGTPGCYEFCIRPDGEQDGRPISWELCVRPIGQQSGCRSGQCTCIAKFPDGLEGLKARGVEVGDGEVRSCSFVSEMTAPSGGSSGGIVPGTVLTDGRRSGRLAWWMDEEYFVQWGVDEGNMGVFLSQYRYFLGVIDLWEGRHDVGVLLRKYRAEFAAMNGVDEGGAHRNLAFNCAYLRKLADAVSYTHLRAHET